MAENNRFQIPNQTTHTHTHTHTQTHTHEQNKKNPYFAYINLTQYKPSSLMHQFILSCIEQHPFS